jgi:cell division protein FtsW
MAKGKKKKFGFFINGKFDYILLIVTLLLLSIGLIILLSASAPTSLSESGNSYQYVVKQGMVAVAGLALMIILSRIDYRIYRKLKWFFYIGLVVLLFAVGFVGTAAGGARRWINIFGFSFQPSEFAKVFFVLFYASLLSDLKEKEKIKKLVPGFIFPLLFLVPIVIAVYGLQNHFSATFIICAITMIQMFVAGTRLTYFFGAAGLGGAGGALYIIKKMASSSSDGSSGFRLDRIQTWLNPDSDFTGKGWQINQSLYAIGSGGLFGVGLGNSKQKYLYLPEPQNDFIFAVLAEELGFFGCSIVILLFLLFVWRGIVISIKAQDNFGTLIGIGLTTMIGLQALVNIAVVTNTIPVTGMPLPFFSYGGSAMLADLIAVGILLSVSRNTRKKNN